MQEGPITFFSFHRDTVWGTLAVVAMVIVTILIGVYVYKSLLKNRGRAVQAVIVEQQNASHMAEIQFRPNRAPGIVLTYPQISIEAQAVAMSA